MVLKRIFTAAVGIPIVLGIIGYCGEVPFFLLVLAVFLIGLWEYFKMALTGMSASGSGMGILLGAVILASAFYDSGMAEPVRQSLLPGACALSFAAVFWYHMSRHAVQLREAAARAMAQLCGLIYVAFLGSYLLLLRGRPDGVTLIFLLLLVAWAGDTAAFAIGSWMGRHRFSKRISPKKTVEGACASLIAGILTALLFKLSFMENLSTAHCVSIGVGLNVLNQFGDLCESFIKRVCEVKDSGTLFPGHGGVLDRLDSLLFAAPFLFHYMNFVQPV